MTTLYVSGPMTGMPDNNFPKFNMVADRLKRAGYLVLNPADKGIVHGWAWADYLRYDLRELSKADGVATLPGWQGSKGAKLEVHIATELDIPVKFWATWALEKVADGYTEDAPPWPRV